MKSLFRILILTLFVSCSFIEVDFAQTLKITQTQLVIIKGDTATVYKLDTTIKKRCKCDKSVKRATKKTGEPRTKFGKVLFDIFDVFKKIIPFLH